MSCLLGGTNEAEKKSQRCIQHKPDLYLHRSPSLMAALTDFSINVELEKENMFMDITTPTPAVPLPCSPRWPHHLEHLSEETCQLNNRSSSIQSGTSEGAVCRICYDGEDSEELVSPCCCTGSVGLLHVSCLEHWLGTSQTTRCELCRYEFQIERIPRSFDPVEFWHNPPSEGSRLHLICDITGFAVLTPITAASAYLCATGAMHYSQWPETWQMQGLWLLTVCLLAVYFIWLSVAVHHHYRVCKGWQENNQIVKITYISPTKSHIVLQAKSTGSLKAPYFNSATSQPFSYQSTPSLMVTTPLLRPILKYSTNLNASSWWLGSDGTLESDHHALYNNNSPRDDTLDQVKKCVSQNAKVMVVACPVGYETCV